MMNKPRPFGIFCPVSAFPSRFGVGDFGREAYRFIDWLHAAQATHWQVLPLTIPDSVGSPYSSPSNLAGDWRLINPEFLVRDGWLSSAEVPKRLPSSAPIDHQQVARTKQRIMHEAFRGFAKRATPAVHRQFSQWQKEQGQWLVRYVLYQAIKDHYRGRPWWEWDPPDRRFATAQYHLSPRVRQRMEYHAFCQWIFYHQWHDLKSYANARGIRIIGDLPFYMPLDSAVVWAQPELFELNRAGHPTVVAGVPPDGMNADGQRWGNPVYRWSTHRANGYRWWIERIRSGLELYDDIRFDHFRGLVAAWHIPARRRDARVGQWVATPGREVLAAIRRRLGKLPLIAEDLGMITPEVVALRQRFRIPGVRVLQYAWSGLPHNPHYPSAISPDVLYYTSTHDTNTTNGWWRDEAKAHERRDVKNYLRRTDKLHRRFIALAAISPAQTVIIPIQDVLGLGSGARINVPGTKRNNWAWRLSFTHLTLAEARRLNQLLLRNAARRPEVFLV